MNNNGLNQNEEFIQQARMERYKFILSELTRLSENTHKHTRYLLTIFPAFASLIIALKFGERGLDVKFISKIAGMFMIVFTMASGFVVVSVLADIASWIDYRKEEVALINRMGGNFRKPPKLRNFWRWYETYLITFIVTCLAAAWYIYVYLFCVQV